MGEKFIQRASFWTIFLSLCLQGHSPEILNKFRQQKYPIFLSTATIRQKENCVRLPYFRVLWKNFLNSKTHKNISFYGAQKFDRFLPFYPERRTKKLLPRFLFFRKTQAKRQAAREVGKKKNFIWNHKSA